MGTIYLEKHVEFIFIYSYLRLNKLQCNIIMLFNK